MSKVREWKLTDGLISWSYGTVYVVERSALAREKVMRDEQQKKENK
jgi:hypothetical protein